MHSYTPSRTRTFYFSFIIPFIFLSISYYLMIPLNIRPRITWSYVNARSRTPTEESLYFPCLCFYNSCHLCRFFLRRRLWQFRNTFEGKGGWRSDYPRQSSPRSYIYVCKIFSTLLWRPRVRNLTMRTANFFPAQILLYRFYNLTFIKSFFLSSSSSLAFFFVLHVTDQSIYSIAIACAHDPSLLPLKLIYTRFDHALLSS